MSRDLTFPQHPGAFVRARGKGEPDAQSLPPPLTLVAGTAFLDDEGRIVFDDSLARATDGPWTTGIDSQGRGYFNADGVIPGDEASVTIDSQGRQVYRLIGA